MLALVPVQRLYNSRSSHFSPDPVARDARDRSLLSRSPGEMRVSHAVRYMIRIHEFSINLIVASSDGTTSLASFVGILCECSLDSWHVSRLAKGVDEIESVSILRACQSLQYVEDHQKFEKIGDLQRLRWPIL